MQVRPPPQDMRQPPQFALSVFRSASQPSEAMPLQLPQPEAHAPTPHMPDAQPAVAWAGAAQTVPHTPQFATVVSRSVSQPSEAVPLQLPQPVLQVPTPQVPAVHVAAMT